MFDQISEDAAISIENSPEYLAQARKVGAYLESLPLTADHHNTLVAMLIEQLKIGREDAFRQAVRLCGGFMRWVEEHRDDEEEPECPIM